MMVLPYIQQEANGTIKKYNFTGNTFKTVIKYTGK